MDRLSSALSGGNFRLPPPSRLDLVSKVGAEGTVVILGKGGLVPNGSFACPVSGPYNLTFSPAIFSADSAFAAADVDGAVTTRCADAEMSMAGGRGRESPA